MHYSIGLMTTGDVYSFGLNFWGQLGNYGNGYSVETEELLKMPDTHGVIAITVNYGHSFVIVGIGTSAVFRVDAVGNVLADQTFYGVAFESGAADIAEWVQINILADPGDVVEFDSAAPENYRVTSTTCSSLVAGVISTAPGMTLGTDLAGSDKALLAVVGIVPVNVTNEGGPIQQGDLLVSSSTPGHAMRWSGGDGPLCVLVGKALEPMNNDQAVILVLLTAQ